MENKWLIFAICREFSRKLAWNGYLPWKFTENEYHYLLWTFSIKKKYSKV